VKVWPTSSRRPRRAVSVSVDRLMVLLVLA
jgi:hypothetical protein